MRKQKTSISVPSSFYTLSSILAFAAINYTIIHSPVVLLLTIVILVHELAHYFYAKSFGADASPPIFLPIPFLSIAFVKIKNLKDIYKPIVASVGTLFGVLTLLYIAGFNYIYSLYSFNLIYLFILFHIIFNFFGSDGAKFRKAFVIKNKI